VVAFVCGIFVFDLCILFVLLAKYVHCCDLSDVILIGAIPLCFAMI